MPELVHNDNADLRVRRLRARAADGRSRAVQAWRMSGWRKRFVAAGRSLRQKIGDADLRARRRERRDAGATLEQLDAAVLPAETPRRRLHRPAVDLRSEEHTSELQSHSDLVCRLLLEKKK